MKQKVSMELNYEGILNSGHTMLGQMLTHNYDQEIKNISACVILIDRYFIPS